MMPGLTEEDEEEGMEEYEEELQFGPELGLVTNHDDEVATTTHGGDLEPVSPMSPILPGGEEENPLNAAADALKGSGQPLTAEALAKLSEEEAQLEERESRKSVELKKDVAR